MTNADDRATLGRVLDLLRSHHVFPALGPLPDDVNGYAQVPALLSALRSALQVPDAAQARRDAIEEAVKVINDFADGVSERADEIHPGALRDEVLATAGAVRVARDRIRALAAQPAARGEKEHEKPEASAEQSAGASNANPTAPPASPPPRVAMMDVFDAFGEDVAFCSTSNIKLRAREWFGPLWIYVQERAPFDPLARSIADSLLRRVYEHA